jgi:hypothetical protein
MRAVFEVAQVAPDYEAQLFARLIQYAWDDAIQVARVGNAVLVDLGELGADPRRVAEVADRPVRVTNRRADLPWITVNQDEEDG